jgi:hypothetical protein
MDNSQNERIFEIGQFTYEIKKKLREKAGATTTTTTTEHTREVGNTKIAFSRFIWTNHL